MATFAFKAVDLSGIPQTGTLDGVDKKSVTSELMAKGLKVMALEEKKSGLKMEISLGPKRVKAAELTVMSRQLATMIAAGMTLLRAFYVLEEQIENPKLRETISAVREDIEAGLNFSDALERHPKVFNRLYVAMVRAGEAGGVLEESLERISDQLEKDDSLRRQIKSAMAYPIVVFSFATLVLIGMIAFIVPVFVGVFEDFGGELPLITRFTVGLSDAVTGSWYILIAIAVGRRHRHPQVEGLGLGRRAVGRDPAEDPVQHRQDRRRRSRWHAGRARSRRSTAPACRSCRRSR